MEHGIDFDRTLERVTRQEERRAGVAGFALTKQGAAIVRSYQKRLAQIIKTCRADRHGNSRKAAWEALNGDWVATFTAWKALNGDWVATFNITDRVGQVVATEDDDRLALKAAWNASDGNWVATPNITDGGDAAWQAVAAEDDDRLASLILAAGVAVGASCEHEFGDCCGEIGRVLGLKGEIAVRVGELSFDLLLQLGIFTVAPDDGGVVLDLTAPFTPDKLDVDPKGKLEDEPDGKLDEPDKKLDEFLDEVVIRCMREHPLLLPLPEPPIPWTGTRAGVLPPDHWARPPLVDRSPQIEDTWTEAIASERMSDVLIALNSLQAVPFEINRPILDLLRASHRSFVPVEGDGFWQQRKLREMLATLQAWNLDLGIAESLNARPFYIPLRLDFRGRVNAITHFAFSREDHIRALFQFARGEPIGEQGLVWLKAHVAARADGNIWSSDSKPSKHCLKDRVAWTDANIERIRRIGEAVLAREPLSKDDLPIGEEPYQFAAACVELVKAIDAGPSFLTRLPLTFDATCSGLQHLCAMTRSEEGRYVNLTPTATAEDFYTRIAEQVSKTSGELLAGISNPRAILKKPVMTFFYGSRRGGFSKSKSGKWHAHGMTEQIHDELKARKLPKTNAQKLARATYYAIEDMVPSAVEVRDFLEQIAKAYSKEGKPMQWTSPLGLPVINSYYKPDIKTINLKVNGKRKRVNWTIGDTDEVKQRGAVQAVSPNFVHTMDAAHLHMIALAAQAEGIDIVSVHDSFGCLAPRAERFNQIVREEFIRLYEQHDVLQDVLEEARQRLQPGAKLPSPPTRGKLDLQLVRESQHAFK